MNDYYNAPVVPVDYTLARADQIRQQLAGVAGGFDKLPLPQDLHENRIGFVVAGGTENALTAELSVAPLSYEDGMTLKIAIATTNTGPVTINVNGLGVVPIVGRLINPLGAGDLVAETVETMIYYAGKFIIREVSGARGPQGERGPEGPLNGRTILNGAAVPTTEGDDGDFYIRTGVWTIYGPKVSGVWGSATSILGSDGNSVLSGAGAPAAITGNNGDFYINTNVNAIYGPKTAGLWGSATPMIGTNGNGVLSGAGVPSVILGVNGDFYIDTNANAIYGPKTAGLWGSSTSLTGPQGIQGNPGIPGTPGTGGSWTNLSDRPKALLELAAIEGSAGKIPYFSDNDENIEIGTILEIVNGLDATNKGLLAAALGAIRVHSTFLGSPGYIRVLLPEGQYGIFQWGTAIFNGNASTVVPYPSPIPYRDFSVAICSSAAVGSGAQDNPAGVVSCGLTSFVAYSAVDSAKPGFWIAWGI